MTDEGINLTITETEIPSVSKDSKLSNSVSGVKLAAKAADQALLAKQAVIKQAIAMVNIAIVYGTKFVTEGRVSTEAALTPAEAEALAAVWAPLITVASPLTLAIITTGGIITAKSVTIMQLNEQRKKENDDRNGTTESNRNNPAPESGSESTSTLPNGSSEDSDNRITGGLLPFSDVTPTTRGDVSGDSGSGEQFPGSPPVVQGDD